jgi:NADH:ubiquinone oxidoreductase subunit E
MLEINICVGTACHLMGAYNIIHEFQEIIEENNLHDRLSVNASFCMQHCGEGVSVRLGETKFNLIPGSCREFFNANIVPQLDRDS